MSGLFGFYNLNGRPLERAVLGNAQTAMQRRGTLFYDSFRSGPIGLGFTANHPAEGSLYVHSETSIVVTADARLDNSDDLTALLSLDPNTSFAEIIVKSYLKWGQDCPSHLQGDFAFVIWDPRHKHLFGARDRLGLKQLLYHYTADKVFGCATDAKTLFAHDDIKRRMSEARLLDFFVGALEGVDKSCTAFEGVSRLPPGHSLLIKNGQLSLSKYWSLEPEEPSQLKTDDAFVEAFQAHLQTAVARRFDSPETTGVMVSGGMDSSAAAAMAVQKFGKKIKAFSAINSADPDCVETRMINLVNEHLGVAPNYVDLAKPEQWLEDAQSGLDGISDPFDSNMNLMRSVIAAAARDGMTVLMDGAWGDTVFAPGSHVRRAMRAGQFVTAMRALKADRDYHGETGALPPVYLKMLASSFLSAPLKSLFAPLKHRRHAAQTIEALGLKKEFAERHNLAGRLSKLGDHVGHASWHNSSQEAEEIVSHPYHVVARERYDRVAAHFGVIMRDPFTDLDLVKFCLSLPTSQKTANSIPKILLRRAMSDMLPEPVISRLSKEHLGYKFSRAVIAADKKVLTKSYPDLISILTTDISAKGTMTEDNKHNLHFAMNWLSVAQSGKT